MLCGNSNASDLCPYFVFVRILRNLTLDFKIIPQFLQCDAYRNNINMVFLFSFPPFVFRLSVTL